MAIEFTPLEWVDSDDPATPATLADPFLDAATLNAREQKLAELVGQINALTADAGSTELELAAKADLVGGTVPVGQLPPQKLADATDLDDSLAAPGKVVAVDQASPLAYHLIDLPPVEVTQAELDSGLSGKADTSALTAHTGSTANPHSVTKAQVGLGSVDDVDAASLRDRATHTGTQPSTSIADFTEAVQDAVAALLGAGSNVILNYDDAANTLTVSATGAGGTGLDAEQVRDAIGVALVGVGNVSVVVNDAADTITISTTATANATDAQLRDRSTHTGTQASSSVTGLSAVATSGAYADLTGKPTIPAAYSDEQAQDAAAAAFTGGTHTGISFAYDDAGNRISATVTGGTGGVTQQDLDDAIATRTALSVDGTFAATYDLDTTPVTPADIGAQPVDPDLTAIAGLAPANDEVVQRKAGAWTNRTPAQLKTDLAVTKADVGLGSVDNTADTAKPVSTAQQTALNAKAPLASPAFTGTPTGITKTHVGLSNVANVAQQPLTTTITAKTASYTLALADAGTEIAFDSASAVTVTIPPNSAVAFPVGTTIELSQVGAGQVTVAPGAGVALQSRGAAMKTAGQHAQAAVRKVGADTWRVIGDVVA